ncbi:carbohydrate kinase family protein [archaeon]|nr:carbohydrate kinase family protein [archaeon]NCQ50400.1 carbohydrate kinase family protein [archaeon]
MKYLLSGSFAYDTILLHKGHFHARILPESLSRLNVSFGIDDSKHEFGGTCGNIAYNSSLLKEDVLLCSSVGNDFDVYRKHLEKNGISTDTLTVQNNLPTAHAWILTDQTNNQITGFQLGAMNIKPQLPNNAMEMSLWHLAPDNSLTTAFLAKIAKQNNVEYFLDPGQSLPSFLEGDADSVFSFDEMIKNATGVFVNEYESQLIQDKLKISLRDLVSSGNKFLIETLGSNGLNLHTKDNVVFIPVAKASKITDPTGCGDAFRAGFLYGYSRGMELKNCAEIGAVMGSFAVESSGGQNHTPTILDISNRLKDSFQWELEIADVKKFKNNTKRNI